MTVHGTLTGVPSNEFAFPRPYVEQLIFYFGAGAIIAQTGREFLITDGFNPTVHVVCNFLTGFWGTNSNRYTLDRCIEDWYLLIDPSPTPLPLDFTVRYLLDATNLKPSILVGLVGATTLYKYNMPPPPSDYWTPV